MAIPTTGATINNHKSLFLYDLITSAAPTERNGFSETDDFLVPVKPMKKKIDERAKTACDPIICPLVAVWRITNIIQQVRNDSQINASTSGIWGEFSTKEAKRRLLRVKKAMKR